jgi:hypothetical protein
MCSGTPVSFARDVQPIFADNCVTGACHGGVMPQEGLSLEPGEAFDALVAVTATQCTDGRKRVAPGDPQHSYVMDKLLGIDMCGQGAQMPKGKDLPEEDMAIISRWICAGALND